jgi:serine/threonine-protein kinase
MLAHRIGRYDVTAEIGRGPTSIVYRAVDPAGGRVVAVKTLQRSGADDDVDADAILLRFRNEARTVARLRHPGIVCVDEFGEDGLHSWIAMEHVEGSTLDELLLRTPLPGQARALAILDELLDALGCVHAEGLCHRDVKPSNILLTAAGRVKLTDFGVARLRDLGLTRVSSLIGTPAFLAPEQFTGAAPDHRADLFACGVLLFRMLAGRCPFTGAPAAVMQQILHEEPPSLSEACGGPVGRAFDPVVARALAKRPQQRYASAGEMRAALRTAAARAGAADDDLPGMRPPAPFDDPLARVALREPQGRPARVDVLSLYAPDVDEHGVALEGTVIVAADAGSPADAAGLPPEACSAARQLLTRRLGPVAGVLVKRAADACGGSVPAFVASLLAEVPAAQRDALRAELAAVLAAPQPAGFGR